MSQDAVGSDQPLPDLADSLIVRRVAALPMHLRLVILHGLPCNMFVYGAVADAALQ